MQQPRSLQTAIVFSVIVAAAFIVGCSQDRPAYNNAPPVVRPRRKPRQLSPRETVGPRQQAPPPQTNDNAHQHHEQPPSTPRFTK